MSAPRSQKITQRQKMKGTDEASSRTLEDLRTTARCRDQGTGQGRLRGVLAGGLTYLDSCVSFSTHCSKEDFSMFYRIEFILFSYLAANV